RLKLYKFYIPLIVDAISDSINIDQNKLTEKFIKIAEKHVKKELTPSIENDYNNKYEILPEKHITKQEELPKNMKQKNKYLKNKKTKAFRTENLISRKKTTLDDFNRR
ncbi:MAG TPA: hypothetical protein VFM31_01085, partial [Nitrososphaeraceae archaeon]|nr:hypothetical protein [Nitrososphaeraceae archaeon]